MSGAALSIRNLKKAYGALTVTDDVSLEIEPNELHAIIGPNGAGKTTLIDQFSGRTTSDSGRILYDDTDITRLAMPERAARGIARSFQITSLLPDFTVLENAALAVQARSGSSFRFFRNPAKERALDDAAKEALHAVGLNDLHRRASDLSHGEKRQLEFAVALACAPRLLLLDEPLAGTGHQEAGVLSELMRSLKGRHTIVLIEHDMEAVFGLADRVSVLVYGRILITGEPAAVRADPQVRAAYLGEEENADA